MIKDLRDARLVDAVPRVVAGQDWVRALSEAVGVLHERTLRYIDDSQIYTSLDTATEPVLDALAINWKVDWYDTGYSVEQKRRVLGYTLVMLEGQSFGLDYQAELGAYERTASGQFQAKLANDQTRDWFALACPKMHKDWPAFETVKAMFQAVMK